MTTLQVSRLDRSFVDVVDHEVTVLSVSPAGGQARGVLLIVPTIGSEGEDSYRTMVVLAHRGAAEGLFSVVLDLSGVGDSADVPSGNDVAKTWVADVTAGAAYARKCVPGAPVNVVGYGVGGTIVTALSPEIADLRVAWEPMTSRQFQRRLRMLSAMAAAGAEGLGVNLTAGQLTELSRLDWLVEGADPSRLLVRIEDDPGIARMISQVGAYRARVPQASITELVGCLQMSTRPAPVRLGLERHHAVIDTPEGPVLEQLITVGPDALAAVMTLPSSGRSDTVVLFSPQGTERASGPASLWTTVSRKLAVRGVASVRCERRLIGPHSTPDSDREPNPYRTDSIADVEALMRHGVTHFDRVAVVGSCAGAWLALKAAQRVAVDEVVALNVPAWPNHTGVFTAEFLERWHGVQPPEEVKGAADAPRPPSRLIRISRAAATRWPLARKAVLFAKAAQSQSVGLPLLRQTPRSQQIQLLLSPADADAFGVAGGKLLQLRRPSLHVQTPPIDHALRRASSQKWVSEWLLARYGSLPSWTDGAKARSSSSQDPVSL